MSRMWYGVGFLDPNCSERIKKAFLDSGFTLYAVGHGEDLTKITSEKISFLPDGQILMLKAEKNAENPAEMLELLQDPEVIRPSLGELWRK